MIGLGFIACGEETGDSLTIQRGKTFLAQNLPQFADQEFSRYLESHPDSTQAAFGRSMARVQGMFHLMDWVLTLAGQNAPSANNGDAFLASPGGSGHRPSVAGMFPAAAPLRTAAVEDENNFVRNLLTDVFRDLYRLSQEVVDGLNRAVEDRDFRFEADSIPLVMGNRTWADLGGVWTARDVRLLAAAANAMHGMMLVLMSQDLKADYFGIFAHAKPLVLAGGLDPGDITGGTGLPVLLNVAAFVFGDPAYPNFLGPSPIDADEDGQADGETFPTRSREHMATGLEHFLQYIERALSDSDSSAGPCVWEAGNSTDRVGTIICRSGDSELKVAITSSLQSALERMKSHLERHDPAVLSLKNDLSAPIASIASAIGGSGLIDLGSAGALLGEPSLIESAIRSLIPMDIGLDLYTFLGQPVAFRRFVPAIRTDLKPEENNFLFEWECPDAVAAGSLVGSTAAYPNGGITCPADAVVGDAPHFSDPVFGTLGIDTIAADGFASGIPYVPFADPTFGGLLYLESNARFAKNSDDFLALVEGSAGSPSMDGVLNPANLFTLNSLLAQIGSLFSGLL